MSADAQTLVLDQGYQPIQIIPWQAAVTLIFQEKCQVVASYDGEVHSPSVTMNIPSVIRLIDKIHRPKKPAKFSRVNVYARDGYRCQYCGDRKSMGELTYDHVVPRAQGGRTTWTNIVSACNPCNGKKANKTPAQAGMRLLKQPIHPIDVPVPYVRTSNNIPASWQDYIFQR